MNINQFRPGNIIVVYPREGQEGLLAVSEIQSSSILCDMISPRKGYQFRIQPFEINAVKLTADWLKKASFYSSNESNRIWSLQGTALQFYFNGSTGYFAGSPDKKVSYVHELQNTFHQLTGKEIPMQDI